MANEAAIIAAKNNRENIEMSDFTEAFNKIILGVENRSLGVSEEDMLVTAYHEAGHALVSLFTKDAKPLKQITCIPRGESLGVTIRYNDKEDFNITREKMISEIAIAFGGLIAEEATTKTHSSGVSSDLKKATSIARNMVCKFGMSSTGKIYVSDDKKSDKRIDDAIKEILEESELIARNIITKNYDKLILLGQTLKKEETMTGEEVLKCLGLTSFSNYESLV
jgi:cell division protease FtsH